VLKRRGTKEIGGLLVLFVLLIAVATFYEQVGQERVASNAPTTANTQADGVRALYLLYQREGIATEPLKASWTNLGVNDGLLVFVEPTDNDRPIGGEDIKVLDQWIRAGGTLLDLVSDPPVEQPLQPSNTVSGDAGATAGAPEVHEVQIDSASGSQLVSGVANLSVRSLVRITLAKDAPYRVIARDAGGPIAVEKPMGKGRVILVADRFAATNAGLAQADNAVFLVNIARKTAADSGKAVRFDEYHHGMGFAERVALDKHGIWDSAPLAWRLAILHLAALGLLLLYNGNRRFGPALVNLPVRLRASTDYVNSMARLYRRAGAADIAVETLYTRFLRDLKRALDVPTDAGITYIARLAQQKFGAGAEGLQQLLIQGEGVVAGQRVTEQYMLHLAKQIEHYRRVCQLVGV